MWRPSPDAHRSIIWRDTLLPLKQGLKLHGILPPTSIISALDTLVSQPNSTAVKEHEVSEDLSFLAQQLRTLQAQGHSAGRGEVLFCRLVASALHSRRVLMQPAAANIVCSTLRDWADNSDDSDASGDRQLQVEALHALAALLQDNMGQIAAHEQTAVLALLHALAHGTPSPLPSPSGAASRRIRPSEPIEVRRQALQALAACCPSKPGIGVSAMPLEGTSQSLQCVVQVLQTCSVDQCPPQDAATSKFLATLVRTLNSLLLVAGKSWTPHTGAIVSGICSLMTYGLPASSETPSARASAASAALAAASAAAPPSGRPAAGPPSSVATHAHETNPPPREASSQDSRAEAMVASTSAASPGPPAGVGKTRYLPPHLRAAAAAATTATAGMPVPSLPGRPPLGGAGAPAARSGQPTQSPRSSAAASRRGDRESDGEDGGSEGGWLVEVDRFKSSRVRLGLLQCLQTMAKSDSRALHQHWTQLLPAAAHPPSKAPAAHLGTMLLHDSVAKVRSMAAATIACILEGPQQRAYLAVAEAKAMLPVSTNPQHQQHQAGRTSSTPLAPRAGGGTGGAGGGGALLGHRGFVTLSASLGQTVLALHACLLQAARCDANMAVAQVALRALCCLMAGAPYDRLPAALLPEVLEGLWSCWAQRQAAASTSGTTSPAGRWRAAAPAPILLPQDLQGGCASTSEILAVQAACLACLAEGLSTKAPVSGLAQHLRNQLRNPSSNATSGTLQQPQLREAQPRAADGAPPSPSAQPHAGIGAGGPGGKGGGRSALPMVPELLACCFNRHAVIRVEALAALRGLASNYPFAMDPCASVPDHATGAGFAPGGGLGGNGDGSCWGATLAAVRLSLECSAAAAAGPGRPAFSPRRSSASGGGGAGQWGAGPVPAPDPTTSSASISPDDKAAQLAVQMLAANLRAQALQLGLRAEAEAELGEVSEPGGPPPPLAVAAAPASAASASPCLGPGVSGEGDQGQGQRVVSPRSPAEAPEPAKPAEPQPLAALAGRWQQAQQLLVPLGCSSHSYMVRSACLAALAALPEPVAALLPRGLQQALLALLARAAESDAAAAVRSMACKVLGVLLPHTWVLGAACQADSAPSGAAPVPPVAPAAAQTKDGSSGVSQAAAQVATDGLSGGAASALMLPCLDSLVRALGDGTLSVRISAAWALANICDALKQLCLSCGTPAGQRIPALAPGPSSPALAQGSPSPALAQGSPSSALASSSAVTTALAGLEIPDGAGGAAGDGGAGVVSVPAWLYEPVLASVLSAVQDVDKVRCSGVRALGSLMALDCCVLLVPSGSGTAADGGMSRSGSGVLGLAGGAERGGLLDRALPSLQSCLTTGNMKVQWTACYAAQELLLHVAGLGEEDAGRCSGRVSGSGDLQGVTEGVGSAAGAASPGQAAVASRLAPLLLLLVMLARDSGNSKIRLHAAAALAAPRRRWVYGDAYLDALLVVCGVLEGQEGVTGAAEHCDSHPPAAAASASAAQGAGGRASAKQRGADAADAASFPNYKYAAALSQQLASTLLHLLMLAQEADGVRLRDALVRRSEVLRRALTSAAQAAVGATELWAVAAAAQDAELELAGGANGRLFTGYGASNSQLPLDPFELRTDLASGSQASTALQLQQQAGQPMSFEQSLRLALAAAGRSVPAAVNPAACGRAEQVQQVVAALRGMERLIQGGQKAAAQRNGAGWSALQETVQLAEPLEQWCVLAERL